jgi:outer membrane protein assembly factor BamB
MIASASGQARTVQASFVALLGLLPTLLIAGCGGASSGPSGPPSASPSSTVAAAPSLADVPTYRGDDARTGAMPGPGVAERPVEVWRLSLPGGLDSQPLIVDGQLIVATVDGEVRAVDAITGTDTWTYRLGADVHSSPAAAAGTFFVVTGDGVLHALSLAGREERWQEPGYLPEATIAVAGGLVLAGTPTALVARRASDGSEVWSVPVAVATRLAVAGDHAYVSGPESDAVVDIDLRSRTVLRELATGGAEALTPTAVDGGVIVGYRDVSGGTNGVVAFADDGALRWRWTEPDAYRIDSVVLGPDTVFVITDVPADVIALDRATGEQRWSREVDSESVSSGGFAGDRLYLIGRQRGLVSLDPSTGDIAWVAPLQGADEPGRVLVTGGIVVASGGSGGGTGRVVAFAAASDPRASGAPSTAPASPPASASPAPLAEVIKVLHTDPNGFVLLPALAPDGTLYALDAVEQVVAFETDGNIRSWGSKGGGAGQLDFSPVTQDDAPMGLAVSPDGQQIAVGEGGNHRVQLFDPAGTSLLRIGRLGHGDSQFVNPAGVAVDGEHRIWVVDTSRADVQVFDERGERLFGFASQGSGPGELLRPGPPFVREDANEVLIPDFANRRIAVFAKDGTFLRNYASDPRSGSSLREVNQVIVDGLGRLFVLDTSGNVLVLDHDGHLVATIPLTFEGLAPLDAFGMALGPEGRLYVADPGQHVIVELQLETPIWPAPAPPSP